MLLAASVVVQVPPACCGKSAVFPPTFDAEIPVTEETVVLERVNVALALDEPTVTDPKLLLLGERVTLPLPETN